MRDFTDGKCEHQEGQPGYDHACCAKCGAVSTDSMWKLARNAWFPTIHAARFYEQHGRLPEQPRKKDDNMEGLRGELAGVLNRQSAENGSDTPDYVLAEFLMACLAAWDAGTLARDKFHGNTREQREAITAEIR
jgi:hypothetical protein